MSPEQANAKAESGDKPKMGISLPGGLGGMFGKKKKAEDAPKEGQPAAAEGPKNRTTFMTSTTELLEVQSSASAADVAIPAGFKQK
jgi:hypothetical protein